MIICRTPLRISFFGGGTDYPDWYKKNSGCVLSVSINKYSYITCRYLPPFFDFKHRIRYYKQEMVKHTEDIEHPSVRESLKFMEIESGVEIIHTADLPAQSGLGSSSTFTVGLLHGLHTLKNLIPTKRELALKAIHVEQELIRESVGSQDQTAASFGGLNSIRFSNNKEIDVEPLAISTKRLAALHSKLLLCFTGFSRNASEIASRQIELIENKTAELQRMNELCEQAREILIDEKCPIESFGELLSIQWELKRGLTPYITTDTIDRIYNTARREGAISGKLLGAGGGGFILFFANEKHHIAIKNALSEYMFVPFRFDFTGSQVVYYSQGDF